MLNGGETRPVVWRFITAGSAAAAMLASSVEPGFAQHDFFDWDPRSSEQPSFVRFSTEALLPPFALIPSDPSVSNGDTSWLDPSPALPAGSPSTTFVRPNEPSATGTVSQPVSCPQPTLPSPGP